MRYKSYNCGGYGSYDGPCGAPDCFTCHPEWNTDGYFEEEEDDDEDDRDEQSD